MLLCGWKFESEKVLVVRNRSFCLGEHDEMCLPRSGQRLGQRSPSLELPETRRRYISPIHITYYLEMTTIIVMNTKIGIR